MRDIARKAKDQGGLPGRVRDLVAKSLHVSSSRIAKYDSILNNLLPELMDEIKADCLPISTAYELSTLDSSEQLRQYAFFHEHGKLPEKAAQSDVFNGNTQSTAAQPDEPAPPNVFHRNTQPAADQPEKTTQSDVFQRNTHPAVAQSATAQMKEFPGENALGTLPSFARAEWSNDACYGYVIMAMEDCGFSKEDIRRVVGQLYEVFDLNSVDDAKQKFHSSPY